jgi:hypothetical protein
MKICVPPYFGVSGDAVVGAVAVGAVVVAGAVEVVGVVGVIGAVGVGCPHDAISRDNTIKQLTSNQIIFLPIIDLLANIISQSGPF